VFRRDNKNSVLNGFGTIFVVIKVLTKTKFIMKTLSKMLVILALLVAGTAVGGYAQDKPKPKEKEKEKKEQKDKKANKEKKEEKEYVFRYVQVQFSAIQNTQQYIAIKTPSRLAPLSYFSSISSLSMKRNIFSECKSYANDPT